MSAVPTVQAVRRHEGRAVLTCTHAGQVFEYAALPSSPYILSGRASAPAFVLTVALEGDVQASSFAVPRALWAALCPLLSGREGV